MEKSVFRAGSVLDSDFLEAVYDGDTPAAIAIFQQYLDELPADLNLLHESFRNGDREHFRRLIHKKKAAFSYVGLTDVTARLNELESKCNSDTDIKSFQPEVESVLQRIDSSTETIRTILTLLQQQS